MLKSMPVIVVGLLAAVAVAAFACSSTQAKPAAPLAVPVSALSPSSAGGLPYFGPPAAFHDVGGSQLPTISISGEGRASAPPDVALITVAISATAPTAAEARDRGKEAINDLLDTLRDNGIRGQDVETRSFSISPVTRRNERTDGMEVTEYRLSNTSIIKLRDVEKVGALLDQLVDRVGDSLRISTITLAIEDPTEIRRRAREQAMRDAQAKAQQLAELSGVRLGPPYSISEGFAGEPTGQLAKEVLVAPVEEGITPATVGELEATVSLFVVYTIVTQ